MCKPFGEQGDTFENINPRTATDSAEAEPNDLGGKFARPGSKVALPAEGLHWDNKSAAHVVHESPGRSPVDQMTTVAYLHQKNTLLHWLLRQHDHLGRSGGSAPVEKHRADLRSVQTLPQSPQGRIEKVVCSTYTKSQNML